MKFKVFGFLFLILFILPYKVDSKSTELAASAQCAILMDENSGRILFEKNIDEQRPIASISKIMTAIVAIENGHLDEYVPISHLATLQVGSSVYLKEGDRVMLKDLIYALLLRSGNDAAYAIAEYVGGDVDTFIMLMNEMAKQLGMGHSTFENPSGLDETTRNISTAYDMAVLMRHAMGNPFYQEINQARVHKTKTLNGNVYVWETKHKLIRNYDYIIGGKTGYTKLAKRTLVTVASKDQFNLIAVTLNDSDDWNTHLNLFAYGYKEYEQLTLVKQGLLDVKSIDQIFYIDERLTYPVKKTEMNDYRLIVTFEKEVYYLKLVYKNQVVYTHPLEVYDATNQSLEHARTIKAFGEGLMRYIREMYW